MVNGGRRDHHRRSPRPLALVWKSAARVVLSAFLLKTLRRMTLLTDRGLPVGRAHRKMRYEWMAVCEAKFEDTS